MPHILDPRDTLGVFLDSGGPALAADLVGLWHDQTALVSTDLLAQAMEAKVFPQILIQELRISNAEYSKGLQPALTGAMLAGDRSLDDTETLELMLAKAVLDPTQLAVLLFIEERARELELLLGAAQAATIAELLRFAAVNHQFSVGQLAHDLKPVIGLTERDARQLMTLYKADIEAGVLVSQARRNLKARAERKIAARAVTVLQHELAQAWNEGLLESIIQRRAAGLIDPQTVAVWLTVGDIKVCPVCAPLHLQVVEPGGTFDNVKAAQQIQQGFDPVAGRTTLKLRVGDDVRGKVLENPRYKFAGRRPPAHVRCRCSLGFRRRF